MKWMKSTPFPASLLAADVRLENGHNPPLFIYEEVLGELTYLQILDAMFQDQSIAVSSWRTLEDERYLIRLKIKHDKVERIRLYDKTVEFRRIGMIVSYDGTAYSGFQIQVGLRTISQELQNAVSFVNDCQTKVVGASRTDEGVHALRQTVHFDTFHPFSPNKWKEILNHRLPFDIHIVDVWEADPTFHARYDVSSKIYEYRLNFGEYNPIRRHLEWTVPRVDVERLKSIVGQFEGTHDFTSFCTHQKENNIRTVLRAETRLENNHCILTFEATGFLHHMIRLIVSTSLRIARGELKDDVATLLSARSRRKTTHIAPPSGLTLVDVRYDKTRPIEADSEDDE
jgi:tRNA pseudouridine38-40 synthase